MREVGRNRDRNREKSGGWMEARSRGVAREGWKEEEGRDTRGALRTERVMEKLR